MSNDYFQAFEILESSGPSVAKLYVSKDPATNEFTAALWSVSDGWTITSISRNGEALIAAIRSMRLGFWPDSTMQKIELAQLTKEERRLLDSFQS